MKKILYRTAKKLMILLYQLMCTLFPVNRKRIVWESGAGKSYAGNPRAIYEYMVSHGMDRKLKCVWFYENEPYDIPGRCRQVPRKRFFYLYYMATAGVWVFDSRQPQFLKRRKNTVYIQTWHGTPLKKLALDMEDVFMSGENGIDDYKKNFVDNVRTWDYLISQNPYSTGIFRRAFDFRGEMLEIGYPRNDVLIHGNTKENIKRLKERLGLPTDKKILLYAPTWRDDEYSGAEAYCFRPALSFEQMQKELSREYVMIVKYHYLIMDSVDWTPYDGFVYTFDQTRDIAELFLVSDGLITDYSSVMFDYAILKRPMYFFAYDLEKYRDELRGFYFDYQEEVPGPVSYTTKGLLADIRRQPEQDYRERYQKFCEKYNKRDDGNACRKVCRLIEDYTEQR